MDNRLWSALPEEIIFQIFGRLPWDAVLRSRAVCVKWNLFLRSTEFKTNWTGRDDNQVPLCFISSKNKGTIAFSPVTNSWSETFSPLFHTFTSDDGVSYQTRNVQIVGAANGLLLLKGVPPWDPEQFHLSVINPVDHGVRKAVPLPAEMPEGGRSLPMGMVWDEESQSHLVLLRSDTSSDELCAFHSYDVQRNMLEQLVRWPMVRTHWDFRDPCMRDGRLYCLGDHSRGIAPGKWLRLYRHDHASAKLAVLCRLPRPRLRPRPLLHYATLFRVDEEIMLAGGHFELCYGPGKFLKDLRIWRLRSRDQEASRGAEAEPDPMETGMDGRGLVHRMPDDVVREFNRAGRHTQIACGANDKFLCVASPGRSAAMLDVKNQSWTTLPPHPPISGQVLEGLCSLYLCEPRVDISLNLR